MTLFPVNPSTEKGLAEWMERLGIKESDLEERFVRSRGPGGQNVNKVSSCVILVHRPTGVMVRCQKARSQGLNRFHARRILLEKIERMRTGEAEKEKALIARIRRQKRKRSKRAKLKLRLCKERRAEKKSLRQPIRGFEAD